MIDVLVALREPLLRMGMEAAVSSAGDMRVVGSVGGWPEVPGAVDRTEPDVVLLDVHFQKEQRGVVHRLVEDHPGLAVLVVVEHSEEECAVRSLFARPDGPRLSEEALERLQECCLVALRDSARGCVARTAEPEYLLQAIRTVAAGEIAAAPWLSAILASGGGGGGRGRRPAPISARELDVIALVAQGLGNREIARRLGIREQTVKNHLASIMHKLGLRSRLEVGLFAHRRHLAGCEREPG